MESAGEASKRAVTASCMAGDSYVSKGTCSTGGEVKYYFSNDDYVCLGCMW